MEAPTPSPLAGESLPDIDANLEYIDSLESEKKNRKKAKKNPPAPLTVKEDSLIKDAMEKLPEAVLPHVLNAAEQNQPLEAVYERRHEVKDDPTAPVPIGAVLAERPRTQTLPAAPPPMPPPLPIVQDTEPDKKSLNLKLSYKQGVRLGLISAVVIMVIGGLSYLLIR